MEYVADLVAIPYQNMSITNYRARSMDQIERGFQEMKEWLIRDFGVVKEPVGLEQNCKCITLLQRMCRLQYIY